MSFALILGVLLAVFAGSQIYWYVRARTLVKRLGSARTARLLSAAVVVAWFCCAVSDEIFV